MTMSSSIKFNEEFKSQMEQLKANCKSTHELCRIVRQLYGGTSDEEILGLIKEMESTNWLAPKPVTKSKTAQKFEALFN